MKRVADYIIEQVVAEGAKHIFFVPGSGCMHLVDALARDKNLVAVNMNHEQAAGMAALAYAQANKQIGACVVTTGCGGTNAITALLHAWQDSIPCVFISGQAERVHTIRNSKVKLRQYGRQEADIVQIVSPITKYAVMINAESEVVYEVEKALYIARSGRKGPVWIDVPLDIQGALIDDDKAQHYMIEKSESPALTKEDVFKIKQAMEESSRPIILAGNGIHLANAEEELIKFAHKYNIPVVHSRLGCDLLPAEDDLSIGMIGMLGASRAGNFAIQNSDFVLCIGCRLSINSTGYDYAAFARDAKLFVIDIDEEEHKKDTVSIDAFFKADAKDAFAELMSMNLAAKYDEWLTLCRKWKKELPILLDDYKHRDKIDMYDLAEQLSRVMPGDSVLVSDAGDGYYIGTTGIQYKAGQMAVTSGAQAEMGFALPGAIGVYFATQRPTVAFVGDGSLMMNLQELATVRHYNIPLKIVVINNNGYSCIRKLHVESFRRYVGCDPQGGLGLPKWEKIADSFEIKFKQIQSSDSIQNTMKEIFECDEPVLCEVLCTEKQQFLAVSMGKNSKGKLVAMPLENQAPFLPRDIYEQEMVIGIYE